MDRDGYTEMPVFADVLLFPCVTGTFERMRHGGRSGWRGSAEGSSHSVELRSGRNRGKTCQSKPTSSILWRCTMNNYNLLNRYSNLPKVVDAKDLLRKV